MSSNQYTKPQVVTDTHKSCSFCGEMKLFSEFHQDRTNVKGHGRAFYCKACANSKSREHNAKHKDNPDYARRKKDRAVKTRYGINLESYQNKLTSQECKCAICKVHLPMSGHFTHLDHDHETGKIRDFLCTNCNRGLGHFQDNKEILMAAIEYLQAHTEDGTQKAVTFL